MPSAALLSVNLVGLLFVEQGSAGVTVNTTKLPKY
jgi:hypothetical protein